MDNLILSNNNINLIATTDVIIATILFIPILFVFTYLYYKINNVAGYKKKKINYSAWWPLIFPYVINFIIWIIVIFTQTKNTSSVWIFYNLYFLTFNLIISSFFSWWYMLSNLPFYLLLLYFGRLININDFIHLPFFYSFLIISLIICLFNWIISFFNSLKKYVIYISFTIIFTIILILNFEWMYSGITNNLAQYISCAVIVICYILAISSYYLNNKFFVQSNAFLILSRNIQYDYLYFFNKASALNEINETINENKIDLMYFNVFNFKVQNRKQFTDIEIETYLMKTLKEIIGRIHDLQYISFITYGNNFAVAIYHKKNNDLIENNWDELKKAEIRFLDVLTQAQKIYEFNDKVLIFELINTYQIYGINNNIVEKIINDTDEIIVLKQQSNNDLILPSEHFYSFIENSKNIKNIIQNFIEKYHLFIYLKKSIVNEINNFFIKTSTLKPLIGNSNEINKIIENDKYANFLKRYIAYIGLIKFASFMQKNDRLFINYPFADLYNNERTWLNLFHFLKDYKLDKEDIVLIFNFDTADNITYPQLEFCLESIKKYGIKSAINFPTKQNEVKWLKKHNAILEKFDFIVINVLSLEQIWGKKSGDEIYELLEYSKSIGKIIYY